MVAVRILQRMTGHSVSELIPQPTVARAYTKLWELEMRIAKEYLRRHLQARGLDPEQAFDNLTRIQTIAYQHHRTCALPHP